MIEGYETIRSWKDEIVPCVLMDGNRRLLGSSYDCGHMASVWLDCHIGEQTEQMIIVGMGDGSILFQALERIRGDIYVFEPDEKIYDLMKTTHVVKRLNKNRRIHLYVGKLQLPDFLKEIAEELNFDNVDTTALSLYPGYENIHEDEVEEVQQCYMQICHNNTILKPAIRRFIESMTRNQLVNISYMENGIPLARLKRYWNRDIPVIMISAGPSLEKNVEWLREAKDKAYLFCVDAAVPTLLKKDIVPDIIASSDANKDMRWYADERCRHIPLLISTNSNTELIKTNDALKIWGADHDYIKRIYEACGIEIPELRAYSGVSTVVMAAILELGAKKIIMVGQDLAYDESGKSHVTGRWEETTVNEDCKTPGYYGGSVYSRPDWLIFLHWFEDAIRTFPEVEFINATEGGAKILGTSQQKLQDVVEGMKKAEAKDDILQKAEVRLKAEEYAKIRQEWLKTKEEICDIIEKGYEEVFFGEQNQKNKALHLVVDVMKSSNKVTRRERFEEAVQYVKQQVEQYVEE